MKGDTKKAKYYYEVAAMRGNAWHGTILAQEEHSGNMDRAVKHWMIAAGAG